MRICLLVLFTILGVNLLVDLLDSNMMEMIQERNESLEKAIESI